MDQILINELGDELYQAMLQQNQVSLEVLRRGRSQTIRYNIR